jgi:threonylcarbamoyladenosine tRNA methylthiotransferase MtaB
LTAQKDPKKIGKIMTAAVATLGCKLNQCESASISEMLGARGLTIVPFNEKSDAYIINTCTVTGKTDYQSRQLVGRALRKNPEAIIIVTGCYAQRAPQELSSLAGVNFVIGNTEKALIPDLLLQTGKRSLNLTNSGEESFFPEIAKNEIIVGDIRKEKAISPLGAAVFPEHTRAFLKIQDGCDAFCSYCIVPYTRGTSRSLFPEETMQRLARLAANGYREIVLTGIHLGAWGRDLRPPSNFTSLLGKIVEKRLFERLRISSLEPREVTTGLLSLIRGSDIICPHLHLSLQSGSNRILKQMRRNYDTAFFRELVLKLQCAIPGLAIGIDVIAGFPGETEEEFAETLSLIEELPLAYLHAFPFSRRPGTPAATMPGQVTDNVKKNRVKLLREAGAAKRRSFAERFLGKPLKVLIERRTDKETGHPTGFSENYIPVAVRGSGVKVNSIVRVVPESLDGERLIANAIGC